MTEAATITPRPRATAARILAPAVAQVRAFTARIYADRLGLSARAIRKRLGATTTWHEERGQKSPTWPLSALPSEWRDRLQSFRQQSGHRTVEAMLSDVPPQRWTPLDENTGTEQIAGEFMEEAVRRRDVYAPALLREGQAPAPSRAELLGIARDGHRKIFGSDGADDRHDYVMENARRRDRGFAEFHRAELYLDAAAFRSRPATAEEIGSRGQHAPLLKFLEEIADTRRPDAEETAMLFDRAFRHYEGLCAVTPVRGEHLRIKRSLLDWLLGVFPCPILAQTPGGLDKAFNRDMARWVASGRDPDSLLPNYSKAGRPAHVCKPCWAKVNARARKLRGQGGMGNTTLAYRQLRTGGELCPACCGHYKFNVATNKSYVPRSFRVHAAPNPLELGLDRGQTHMEAVGPKIVRDWSDTMPGDYFVGDDETSNHLVHTRVDGELVFGRVQILHLMDLKTMNPLDFFAYFGPPLATMNRKLLHEVLVNGVGLPRQGFLFEKGAYAARLIIGKNKSAVLNPSRSNNPWSFTESGLLGKFGLGIEAMPDGARASFHEGLELGLAEPGLDLHVRQATRAWSKPIEGCLHIFQKMMSGLRGFVGFQERDEIPDRLADFIRRAKNGQVDPNDEFPSLDEYVTKYWAVLDEFRHEPQPKSRRLRGASPLQAWNDYVSTHALRKLPADMAYLLATHKKPATIKADGIVIEINCSLHSFSDRRLGDWYGRGVRDVLAFYNIDFPQLLHVSDMNRKNFLTIRQLAARATTAHRTASGRAQLANAQRSKRDFMAAATQRFSGRNIR